MTAVVEEWMRKAEGDYLTATREFRADPPNYDAACYHAQQCIEKLLKALLISRDVVPPKTHDLVLLDSLVRPVEASWAWRIEDIRLLSRAATVFRYPGEIAGQDEAEASLAVCAPMRTRLLLLLHSKPG